MLILGISGGWRRSLTTLENKLQKKLSNTQHSINTPTNTPTSFESVDDLDKSTMLIGNMPSWLAVLRSSLWWDYDLCRAHRLLTRTFWKTSSTKHLAKKMLVHDPSSPWTYEIWRHWQVLVWSISYIRLSQLLSHFRSLLTWFSPLVALQTSLGPCYVVSSSIPVGRVGASSPAWC